MEDIDRKIKIIRDNSLYGILPYIDTDSFETDTEFEKSSERLKASIKSLNDTFGFKDMFKLEVKQ